jgi:hypothetical protein
MPQTIANLESKPSTSILCKESNSQMEQFLHNDTDFQFLYNCTFYNVSDIPLENRRNISLGILELLIIAIELVKFKIYH